MKFINFFKTPLGIFIIVVIVLAIILVSLNWETIKGWFTQAPTDIPSGRGRVSGSGNITSGSKCISLGGGNCSYNGLYVPCAECTKRGIVVS